MSQAASPSAPGQTTLIARLAALKAQAQQGKRPAAKAVGRWLGDFLTYDSSHGLLPAELRLLDGCARGEDVNQSADDKKYYKLTEDGKAGHRASIRSARLGARKAGLHFAVKTNLVRAAFLRFLILGGDDDAPVHEKGIQLWNTRIEGDLDIRSGKCVSRIALIKCILAGELCMQDATFDVLVLSGSWLRALHANRAKINGAIWLNENFIADGPVQLFGIEVGGRLDCSEGHFAAGIEAPGAEIGGDLNLERITATGMTQFVNAKIGGSVKAKGASFSSHVLKIPALDFSRATVKGDVTLASAVLTGIGGKIKDEIIHPCAMAAQGMTVNGSMSFGGDFKAVGMVSLYGSEILKDLKFGGGTFDNRDGECSIKANSAKVSGAIDFSVDVSEYSSDQRKLRFRSFGAVSLISASCGYLICDGALFKNINVIRPPKVISNTKVMGNSEALALDCGSMSIARSASFRRSGERPFYALGRVSLQAAQIGESLVCAGGIYFNPRGVALSGEAAKISSVVFLGAGADNYKKGNPGDFEVQRKRLVFRSYGRVNFVGASVGLNFYCLLAELQNAKQAPGKSQDAKAAPGKDQSMMGESGDSRAADALDLTTATIGNVLVLGREFPDDEPPIIRGSVNLTGATARMLIDDGFLEGLKDKVQNGIKQQTTDGDGKIINEVLVKTPLTCHLRLDQFTYERLRGDKSCDPEMRLKWLDRQPPEDMHGEFKPQPFEQLVTVMRAMGYDDKADDIALSKRRHERQADSIRSAADIRNSLTAGALRAMWSLFVNGLERVFIDGFIGYGYHMGRAVLWLLLLCGLAAEVDALAYQQGKIVPVDKEMRIAWTAAGCFDSSDPHCPSKENEVIPRFQPVIYAADVMIPIIGLGQKAAWTPANDARWLYWLQLGETVFGWVGGSLLAAFVTGLLGKE